MENIVCRVHATVTEKLEQYAAETKGCVRIEVGYRQVFDLQAPALELFEFWAANADEVISYSVRSLTESEASA